MHYLITGHTGFKGTWLTALLLAKGHIVSGISLDPEPDSLFSRTNLSLRITNDFRLDIRDKVELTKAVLKAKPDAVIHLAAQPLVRKSYTEPVFTFETNILGTLNLLTAIEKIDSIKACLIITTDKVYKDFNNNHAYLEGDPLGGTDPYSASKSAADILTQSWIRNITKKNVAIARAGNVIGGGDWSLDRLVPDVISAIESKNDVSIRYPNSIRPWQHVLDCLNGYLLLVDAMLKGERETEWNFGPSPESMRTVLDVVQGIISEWGVAELRVILTEPETHLKESHYLVLDSSKSREKLGWRDELDFNKTLKWTTNWYKKYSEGQDAESLLIEQITNYLGLDSN